MGSEWRERLLADFVTVKHGFAFKGVFFKDSPTVDCLVTPGNFEVGGGFKLGKLKYYQGPVPEDYVLEVGDLVVTMTDLSKEADTLGYSALVPEITGVRLLHNQRVGLVEFKNEELDKIFLSYLLRTSSYRHHVISSATGTTVKHTSPTKITSFTFPKPPKKNQHKIGEFLLSIDSKIQLNRQINQTLEAMAQALFKSWFVDFDPVIDNALAAGNAIPEALEARAEQRRAVLAAAQGGGSTPAADGAAPVLLPENTRALFPDAFVFDAEMGWVPEGWEVGPVGDVIENVGGGTPKTKEMAFWENGVHSFCTPKDMSSLNSKVMLSTDRKLTDAGVAKISSGLLAKGTVLMSSRAPIGYLAINEIPVAVNQGVIAMKPNESFSSEYILCWAEENMEEVISRANGSTFLEISKKNFRDIPFLNPAKEQLASFDSLAKPIFGRITSIQKEVSSLEKLRDALLPKLISGELRIADSK